MQKGFDVVNLHGTASGVIAVPYIGENGNWFIGNEDTGITAHGEKGDKGDPGAAGSSEGVILYERPDWEGSLKLVSDRIVLSDSNYDFLEFIFCNSKKK